MKSSLLLPLIGLALGASALGAPQTFDFKDPKGVNTVIFSLDAPLEAINGSATGISGEVQFDPANPATLKGTINVATASMQVPNPMMKEHLHGKDWMDAGSHPTISFAAERLSNVQTSGDVTTGDVTGKLTVRGVSREVTVPVKLTYLKDKLKARGGPKDGDLLVLRANFSIKRSDFGINSGKFEEKVSDDVQLKLSLAGASPR